MRLPALRWPGGSPMRLACAASMLLVAGCGVTRPPAQVEAPLPERFEHAGVPLPHQASLIDLRNWWRQLDDPLLVELIDSAQAANPDIASAGARIAEARATRVGAGAALLPGLNGSLSASRSNSPSSGFGGGVGTDLTGASGATGGAAGTGTGLGIGSTSASIPPLTILQARLQASWEIDLFGNLRATRDAAGARLSAAEARWHQARVSVAAETASAYLGERACQRQLAVSITDARSRSETSRLTDLSANAGFTAPADAALARAGASDAASRLTQQRAQCELQRQALSTLTGIDSRTLANRLAAAPVDRAIPSVPVVTRVPAEALAQRPDVHAAELNVAAASAEAGAARAQRYPRLSLQGSIGRLQIRTSGIQQSFDSWSIGPVSLSVPIFDGGRLAANEDAARARYDEAVSLYRASARQAVREVEEALINLQATDSRSGDAQSAVRNYQSSFDATQARYQSGLASLFELEDSRRTLFAAQTAQVALQRERAEAWIALYRAMGGGWSAGDATAASGSADTSAATAPASATPSVPPVSIR